MGRPINQQKKQEEKQEKCLENTVILICFTKNIHLHVSLVAEAVSCLRPPYGAA